MKQSEEMFGRSLLPTLLASPLCFPLCDKEALVAVGQRRIEKKGVKPKHRLISIPSGTTGKKERKDLESRAKLNALGTCCATSGRDILRTDFTMTWT